MVEKPLSPGQTLKNGRYRITERLGQGGMGAVYKAWDKTKKKCVALKQNLYASNEKAKRQFKREARILQKLRHPNLPRVTDRFEDGQGQYLVMEFIDGEDLGTTLEQMKKLRGDKFLPVDQVLNVISQICDALVCLHSQRKPVIHRDIKPANIKIDHKGKAMLVDFGIAKIYDPKNPTTTTGAQAISAGYSPPEQYGGTTDVRSDIYALGATLYHLLTGEYPTSSMIRATSRPDLLTKPRELNQNIKVRLERAILKAMKINPEERYQTIKDFQAALPVPTKPLPAGPSGYTTRREPKSSSPARRSSTWRLRLVLLNCIGLILVVVLMMHRDIFGNGMPQIPIILFPNTGPPSILANEAPSPTTSTVDTPSQSDPENFPQPARIAYVLNNQDAHHLAMVGSDGMSLDINANLILPQGNGLPSRSVAPVWSLNGKKIFYFGRGGIKVIESQGDVPSTPLLAVDHVKNMALSPDGTKLAYEFGPPDKDHEVVVIDTGDGRILNHFFGEQPAWGPDSKTLAVRNCRPDCGLWLNDESDWRQITFNSTDCFPAWSPTGEYLAFTSEGDHPTNWDIYLLKMSGNQSLGVPTRLTDRPSSDITPVFSRDGQEIYMRTDAYGDWAITVMRPDGSDEKIVADNIGPCEEWGQARPAVY